MHTLQRRLLCWTSQLGVSRSTSETKFRAPDSLCCPTHGTAQIQIIGVVPNRRTVVLNVSNFSFATFGDIMAILVGRQVIPKKDAGAFCLGYGGWGRTKPLSLSAKLSDIGIQPHSTLVLSLKTPGGSFRRNQRAFVDVPPRPLHHQPPTYVSAHHQPLTSISVTHTSCLLLENAVTADTRDIRAASKRKRTSKDVDSDAGGDEGYPDEGRQDPTGTSSDDGGDGRNLEENQGPKASGKGKKKQRMSGIPPSGKGNLGLVRLEKENENQSQSASASGSSAFGGKLQAVAGGHYESGGIRCKHSSSSSWKGVDWSSRTDEDELDEFDNSCLALQEFDMWVYRPFNAVICRQCQLLLDLNLLASHVKEKHGKAMPITNRHQGMLGKFDFFLAHVNEAFGILPSFYDFQYKIVHRPISFLSQPASFLNCPKCEEPFENNEATRTATEKRMGNHFRENPECFLSEEVEQAKKRWAEMRPQSNDLDTKYSFSKVTHRYAQLACRGQASRRRWIIYCPEGWTPPVRIDVEGVSSEGHTAGAHQHELTGNTLNQIDQSYAVKLGWDTAFKTKTGNKIDLWKRLMRSLEEGEGGDSGQEQEALERGLLEIRKFLYDYLHSANTSVKSYCEIFRRQLTNNGRSSSRSMYRDLAPKSMARYRDSLWEPVALLLRYRLVLKSGKVDYGQGHINLHLEKHATHAAVRLYNFLVNISSEEEIPRDILAVHVHQVLVCLLTSQAPSSERIGGLFDLVMALKSYMGPDQGFGPPSIASSYCAMLQYGLRTIVIHIARLGGIENAFKILELPVAVPTTELTQQLLEQTLLLDEDVEVTPRADLENCDPLDIGEGELNQLVESEMELAPTAYSRRTTPSLLEDPLLRVPALTLTERILDPFLLDTGDEENEANGKELEGSEVFISMKKDDLLATLKENSIWIDHLPSEDEGRQPTVFQRIKLTWLSVWPLALKVMGPTQIMPDEAGLVFTYSSRRVSHHRINFVDLKALTNSLITQGKEQLLSLFPSKLNPEELNVHESDLNDSMASTKSIFEQNSTVFNPLVNKVFDQLMEEGEERYQLWKEKGRQRKVQEWLDGDENLIEYILGGISLSSGVPARGFQMSDFLYASSEEGKRNLFIYKSNVVIGFPKSKSFSRTTQDSLWALPPHLSQTVLLYLGVIRPVSMRLINVVHRKTSYLAKTHIFVTAQSWESVGTRSSKINTIVQGQTRSAIGVPLSMGTLRQLITAIFRKHLSDMIDLPAADSNATSIVNRQADHTQQTANHYGQNAGSTTGLNMSDSDIDKFIESSHAWQVLLGIRSPGQKMQERLHKIPADCLKEGNQMIAMDQVRSALCQEYGIGGPNWGTSQKRAREVLRMSPFMPKAGEERLGDGVLIQVVSALIYGHGRPGLKEAAPVDGYSVQTITEAVALIRLALKEWTGQVRANFDLRDLSVKASVEACKRGLYKDMVGLSTAEEKKWRELGLQVFVRVTGHYGQMKGPNLMDEDELE